MSKVEVTTRFAVTVDDLPSAWAFVMDRLDRVGPDPEVTISPVWIVRSTNVDVEPQRRFSCVVSGMIPEDSG